MNVDSRGLGTAQTVFPYHARYSGLKPLASSAVLAACLLALAGPAGAGTDGKSAMKPGKQAIAAAQRPEGRAATPEPAHHWFGESYAELTTRNWRWFMSIPLAVNPTNDAQGLNCGINQEGPVWFLGGPLGGSYERNCTIPYGRAILSPVIDTINDFPCPDPDFKPAPGQSMQAFLRQGAAPFIDSVTLAEAQLDGKPLRVRRVVSKLFGFTGAADLAPTLDPCVTGSPQLAVSDGYFIFIEPPSRGDHVLHIRSVTPGYGVSEGTIRLKIE